jgi:hypothetical protein
MRRLHWKHPTRDQEGRLFWDSVDGKYRVIKDLAVFITHDQDKYVAEVNCGGNFYCGIFSTRSKAMRACCHHAYKYGSRTPGFERIEHDNLEDADIPF